MRAPFIVLHRAKPVSIATAKRRQRTFPQRLVGYYGIYHAAIRQVTFALATSLVVFVAVVVQASVHGVRAVSEGALRLQQLELLVQKVQRVVARESADGELVRDFGPLLTVGGHALVKLSRMRENLLQEPERKLH